MTISITSNADQYLDVCNRLDSKETYETIIAALHVSRTVISKVKKHRAEFPDFIKQMREKERSVRLRAITKKKESTETVPRSTKTVPISTKRVLQSTINKDEFMTWIKGLDREKYHDYSQSCIIRIQDHQRYALQIGMIFLINEYLEMKHNE